MGIELRNKVKNELSNCLGCWRRVCEQLCPLFRDFCQGSAANYHLSCYLLS